MSIVNRSQGAHPLTVTPAVDTSIEHEAWTTYAMNEPLMREFVAKYTGASLAVTTLEITTDGGQTAFEPPRFFAWLMWKGRSAQKRAIVHG